MHTLTHMHTLIHLPRWKSSRPRILRIWATVNMQPQQRSFELWQQSTQVLKRWHLIKMLSDLWGQELLIINWATRGPRKGFNPLEYRWLYFWVTSELRKTQLGKGGQDSLVLGPYQPLTSHACPSAGLSSGAHPDLRFYWKGWRFLHLTLVVLFLTPKPALASQNKKRMTRINAFCIYKCFPGIQERHFAFPIQVISVYLAV
jgi:hypothetical protein